MSNKIFWSQLPFAQNSLIIFNVVLIQNSQFYSKYKPKSKAVEIFLMKNIKFFDEIFDFMLVTKNCY